MLDMSSDEFLPRKNWEDIQRHWRRNILPECIEKANKEGLGLLELNNNGIIKHEGLITDCIQIKLCLGLIAVRVFAEADYFEDYFVQFMDDIFSPFMERNGI